VFRQFRRWTASGLLDVMLEALADGGGEADLLHATTGQDADCATYGALMAARQRSRHRARRQELRQ
jgi:hypothetical protein